MSPHFLHSKCKCSHQTLRHMRHPWMRHQESPTNQPSKMPLHYMTRVAAKLTLCSALNKYKDSKFCRLPHFYHAFTLEWKKGNISYKTWFFIRFRSRQSSDDFSLLIRNAMQQACKLLLLASCLARNPLTRRWRWHITPQRWILSKLHSVTTQKTARYIATALLMSNPKR